MTHWTFSKTSLAAPRGPSQSTIWIFHSPTPFFCPSAITSLTVVHPLPEKSLNPGHHFITKKEP